MRRALFVLLLLFPAAAFAQPGRFELTPFAGYRLAGDFDADSNSAFDPRLNIEVDESAVYGVLFDIPLSPNWQIEIMANRQQTSFSIDQGFLEPQDELGDVDLTTVHGGILLQWGDGQVNPFLVASAGITRIEPKFRDLESDDRFSTSFGGGAKIFFSDNVGLRLEARGFWTDLDTGFDDRYNRYDSGDGLFQGQGSVGLIIAF
jgi:outer membrane protein with beta-barrel domain